MSRNTRIAVVGEGMVELCRRDGAGWAVGHGGDMLNLSLHLARYGYETAFATALGADAFSQDLREKWAAQGLDLGATLKDPHRNAGLYAISTDRNGERSFSYWRSESAARRMFALPDSARLEACIDRSDALVFSLITLAILPPEGRTALLRLARRARMRGAQVVFDGNYRPLLWPDTATAIRMRDEAIACATIGLPTLDDEASLAGTTSAGTVAAHWTALGCSECVVKLGRDGCRLPDGAVIAPEMILDPLDTSGAGDAFGAAYVAGRLAGESPLEAARRGNALAGWVVMRGGAIPETDAKAPYTRLASSAGSAG